MNQERMYNMQINLPIPVAFELDHLCEKNQMKRGPMARMLLSEAAGRIHIEEVKQLQFIFKEKVGDLQVGISISIPGCIESRLKDIGQYVPFSKKKLAEILICQEIEAKRKAEAGYDLLY